MCGAFTQPDKGEILKRYSIDDDFEWKGSWNIRTSQPAVIITKNSPLHAHIASFNFIPSWSKDDKPPIRPINARSETVALSGLFKGAFNKSRCLIPCQYWYEWVATEDGKQPYCFRLKDQKTFSLAGIFSKRVVDGEDRYYFAILTTKPNSIAAKIHDRQPVVLHKEDEEIWLDEGASAKELMELLIAYEPEETEVWPVSKAVSSFKNNSPELVKPI